MKTRTRAVPLPDGVETDLVTADSSAWRLPVGVDKEVNRLMASLSERRHPVLVGPGETGKSAIVRGLALQMAQGAQPGGAKALWQVSLRSIDARCGKDFSVGAQLAGIFMYASQSPARPVVYVRDLSYLKRFDAEHELTTALAHCKVHMLGEARPGFVNWLADNPELAELTRVFQVREPSAAHTMDLLSALAMDARKRDGVQAEPEALARVLHHARGLLPGRKLPGKALTLLDEALVEAKAKGEKKLTAHRVTTRLCEALRLPRTLVDPETSMDVHALSARLKASVVGQDEAVDAVVQRLALYKADLVARHRPLGVLLLAGPQGVGKTLLAQKVAEEVFGGADRLVRLSMGEVAEDWKVDLVFGHANAPSSEARRGTLARKLTGGAFTVLLLDDIEKSHPLAYRHLLRPLDEGVYVNGNDEEVSLQNTLVIMTTNAGDEVYRDPAVGFAARENAATRESSVRKRLADTFPSDLLDRMDRIAVCPPLGATELREVCRREIASLLERDGIAGRALVVDVDEDVLDRIVAEAIAGRGVRALRRSVERHVGRPLAEHILQMSPGAGARIRVALQGVAAEESDGRPKPARDRTEVTVPRRRGPPAERADASVAMTETVRKREV